jgi:predicted nucleotidyltransferase
LNAPARPGDPRQLAENFVEELRDAISGRVRAATLFGSAARNEWIAGVSDVNVLVLLDDIDAPVLKRAAPAASHALSNGLTPLLMELDEWRRAIDVFTIELADMKDASLTLYGEDPVAAPIVQHTIMRLQAERELRAKLLHLHAAMLVAADDRARLGQIFIHALPSFTTYLRTALRLAQQTVPRTSRDVIEQGCALASADPAAFLRVLDARTSGEDFAIGLDEPVADHFNTAAEQLAAYVDAFGR